MHRIRFRMRCLLLGSLLATGCPAIAATLAAQPTQVDRNGSITFNLFDPGATKVELHLEGHVHTLPMKRITAGLWTLTTPPLPPGIYSYVFLADSVPILDPTNPHINPNLRWRSNSIEVPGPTPEPWQMQNVPHGVVHHHFYRSTIVGDQRDYFVYTPPGYNAQANTKYPVLYLLHGYTDDASAWTAVGRANVILDNLIASKRARPMILVMPLGYGAPEIVVGPNASFQNLALRRKNFDRFTQSLLTEVIPQVQAEYRISTRREDRAIAGLSMGGAESLLTGLNHINEFAWIGSFSAGGLEPDFARGFPGLNARSAAQLRLLWIACGADDRYVGPVPLITVNRELIAWLRSRNIPATFVETPGMHEWQVWRDNLIHFAPLLFQPK